jgi:hypothetical protein
METVLHTRRAETAEDIEKEAAALVGLSPSRFFRAGPFGYIVEAHASRWGSGMSLCGVELERLHRIKMAWGEEMLDTDRLRRCGRCIELAPVGIG